MRVFGFLAVALVAFAQMSIAQERSGPLRIEITEGVIEPVPIVVAPFIAENAAAADYAQQITAVVSADPEGEAGASAEPEQAAKRSQRMNADVHLQGAQHILA